MRSACGSSCRPIVLPAFWAKRSQQEQGWRLEPGDIETALNAAAQIGDDTLQRKSQGTVVPESFTHGTSAQRMTWFKRGLETGSVDQCNTFESAAGLGSFNCAAAAIRGRRSDCSTPPVRCPRFSAAQRSSRSGSTLARCRRRRSAT